MSPFHAKLGYTRSIDKYCLKSTKVSYLGVMITRLLIKTKLLLYLLFLLIKLGIYYLYLDENKANRELFLFTKIVYISPQLLSPKNGLLKCKNSSHNKLST